MGINKNVELIFLQNPNDPTILASWRRVVFVEDLFDVIKEVHCREKGHVGLKKTLDEVMMCVIHYTDCACLTLV